MRDDFASAREEVLRSPTYNDRLVRGVMEDYYYMAHVYDLKIAPANDQ